METSRGARILSSSCMVFCYKPRTVMYTFMCVCEVLVFHQWCSGDTWIMSVHPPCCLFTDQQCELPRRWRATIQALVISQSLCAYRRIMMVEEVKYCFMPCKDGWHTWWWGNVYRLFQLSSFKRRKPLNMIWFPGVIIHIKLCHYKTGDTQILTLPTANCNWDTSHSNKDIDKQYSWQSDFAKWVCDNFLLGFLASVL
jgi:hypothetical protein